MLVGLMIFGVIILVVGLVDLFRCRFLVLKLELV